MNSSLGYRFERTFQRNNFAKEMLQRLWNIIHLKRKKLDIHWKFSML